MVAGISSTISGAGFRFEALPCLASIWMPKFRFMKPVHRQWGCRNRHTKSVISTNGRYCQPTCLPRNSSMQLISGYRHNGCLCSNSRLLPLVQCSNFCTISTTQRVIEGGAEVQYRHGLPVLTLKLPSYEERCEFALRPSADRVSDLYDYVRREDQRVNTIAVYSTDGTKIAGSTPIEHLMQSDFHIRLNEHMYAVRPPKRPPLSGEHVHQLNDLKALIANLHTAMNKDEQYLRNERELMAKLETVQQALEPLEKQKRLLAAESEKRTDRLIWLGLALMGVQFGSFARLTWFEYSWDIMEPVTYFATYTAVIGGYAYFCATRLQYEYHDAKDRVLINKFYKLCRKRGFDVEKYNGLRENLNDLEKDLDRLRRLPSFPSSKPMQTVERTITIVRDSRPDNEKDTTIK